MVFVANEYNGSIVELHRSDCAERIAFVTVMSVEPKFIAVMHTLGSSVALGNSRVCINAWRKVQ